MNATPLPSRPVIKQVKKEFNRDESVIVNKRNPFQVITLDANRAMKSYSIQFNFRTLTQTNLAKKLDLFREQSSKSRLRYMRSKTVRSKLG